MTTARSLRDAKGQRNTGSANPNPEKAGLSFVGSGKKKGEKKGAKCSTCEGRGHSSDDCTSKEGSEITCFSCGWIGHYKNKCPSDEKKESATEEKKK